MTTGEGWNVDWLAQLLVKLAYLSTHVIADAQGQSHAPSYSHCEQGDILKLLHLDKSTVFQQRTLTSDGPFHTQLHAAPVHPDIQSDKTEPHHQQKAAFLV